MKTLWRIAAIANGVALVTALGAGSAFAEGLKPKAVVELFTSQGCSSCPPADALLGELAQRTDVIALTLPVDYWDYLGWKDTYANPAFSERQRAYAAKRGDGEVYTPQLVVNGVAHVVGSQRGPVEGAIEATNAAIAAGEAAIEATPDGDELVVKVSAVAGSKGATLWLCNVLKSGPVKIQRGENSGLEATYTNVVRGMKAVGSWDGSEKSFRIPAADLKSDDSDEFALLLQDDALGPMLGGVLIADWR